MTQNAKLVARLRNQSIPVWAFEYNGNVLRELDASEPDCRRHDIEIYFNGTWQVLVTSSLNWRSEIDEALYNFFGPHEIAAG